MSQLPWKRHKAMQPGTVHGPTRLSQCRLVQILVERPQRGGPFTSSTLLAFAQRTQTNTLCKTQAAMPVSQYRRSDRDSTRSSSPTLVRTLSRDSEKETGFVPPAHMRSSRSFGRRLQHGFSRLLCTPNEKVAATEGVLVISDPFDFKVVS